MIWSACQEKFFKSFFEFSKISRWSLQRIDLRFFGACRTKIHQLLPAINFLLYPPATNRVNMNVGVRHRLLLSLRSEKAMGLRSILKPSLDSTDVGDSEPAALPART